MKTVKINEVKQGDYFKRKADARTVYVRNHYDRATKSYSASDTEDMNREIFIKSGKVVFIDFDY